MIILVGIPFDVLFKSYSIIDTSLFVKRLTLDNKNVYNIFRYAVDMSISRVVNKETYVKIVHFYSLE